MATNFTPHRISSPQILERVHPKVLCQFLQRHASFFGARKALLASPKQIDYDRLALMLATPDEEMPAMLMADLFYWDEVAEMGQIEDLVEIAEKHGIKLDDQVTIEEAALLVRMGAPEALEDVHAVYHAHGLLRKKKRFLSYFATVKQLPNWRRPGQRILDVFAQDMDMWYDGQKKGRGTRVSVIEKADAAWFIVRHGGTFKRENALENGEPRIVFYRPEAYDLLIYYHHQGELAIYNDGNSVKERRAYCVYLGKNLFGDPDFFQTEDADKYSLEPLRTKGRAAMDCTDISGLDSARLTYLKYQFNGNNKHSIMHRAADVFTGLEDLGEGIPEEAKLICMGVKLTATGGLGGERTVKLYAPNISVYDHESDAELAHDFLVTQGFILPRNGEGQT
ncbi:MAG: hypothetical protein ACOC8H_02215 [bacterium]